MDKFSRELDMVQQAANRKFIEDERLKRLEPMTKEGTVRPESDLPARFNWNCPKCGLDCISFEASDVGKLCRYCQKRLSLRLEDELPKDEDCSTYPPGEPILIPQRNYKYTTKAIPNVNVRKRWFECKVIHHEPTIHMVWVKMKESGIHKVVSTTEMKFALLEK